MRGPRASRRFSGSRCSSSGVILDDCRYVALVTISFCIAFTSQPRSTNSVASQSSSSGCDGHSPCEPKSSTVFTSPVPKYICQNRFTVTRAVSGFDGSTSQRANPSRLFGAPAGSGGSTAGTPGDTFSPGWSYAPRISKCVSRGAGLSCITITVGMLRSKACLLIREIQHLLLQFSQRRRGIPIEKRPTEFPALCRGPFTSRNCGEPAQGIADGQHLDSVCRQRRPIDLDLPDRALKPIRRPEPRADSQRLLRCRMSGSGHRGASLASAAGRSGTGGFRSPGATRRR